MAGNSKVFKIFTFHALCVCQGQQSDGTRVIFLCTIPSLVELVGSMLTIFSLWPLPLYLIFLVHYIGQSKKNERKGITSWKSW